MECITIVKMLWIIVSCSLLSHGLLTSATSESYPRDLEKRTWLTDTINYIIEFENSLHANGETSSSGFNDEVVTATSNSTEEGFFRKVGHGVIGCMGTLVTVQSETTDARMADLGAIADSERRITKITDTINSYYENMMKDLRRGHPSKRVLISRAEAYTLPTKGSLLSQLQEIVDELIPRNTNNGGKNILEKRLEDVSLKLAAGQWCDNLQSFNDYISHRYRSFADAITKGYILVAGSYMIRRSFGETNTETHMRQIVSEYYSSTQQIDERIHKLIAQSPLSVRRCDPLNHERGKTYIEFEKLIQGYLAHKFNLDARHSVHTSCKNLNATEKHPIMFREKEDFAFFAYTTCSGSIYDCWSARVGSICATIAPSRRYDGFTSLSDWTFSSRPFGNMSPCEGRVKHRPTNFNAQATAESCACYCDDTDSSFSFRRINRHPVWSDYENNMVATGFRLVNDSNTLYLEIKQGKLEEYGFIKHSSNIWRPREQYITTRSYSSPIQLSKDLRSINLNIATVPLGYAIIGAVFTVAEGVGDQPNMIELGIFATPVLYRSGKLLDPLTNMAYYEPKRPKSELKIRKPALPTLSVINQLRRGEDKYIKLQPSDWEKDAAQTVVPFLDIQEVVTNPPTLLGGLGFYYRSTDGYGGFLGLELQTWNYTRILFGPLDNETAFLEGDDFYKN